MSKSTSQLLPLPGKNYFSTSTPICCNPNLIQVFISVFNIPTSITLITIASLCFLNSYDGDFVFDDSEAIINNEDVQTTPLYDIFQNDFWGTKLLNKRSHKSYRPLTILSFRLV